MKIYKVTSCYINKKPKPKLYIFWISNLNITVSNSVA